MGADENAETSDLSKSKAFSLRVEQQLDAGWRIVELPSGELLLVPPGPGAYDAA